MNRSDYYTYLNEASDRFFYVQNAVHFEPCSSGQAFSRHVSEVATALCTMHTDETTENCLYQTMVSFHNSFNAPRFERRSIALVDKDTEEDQPPYLPVGIAPQKNDHAPVYIPDRERFSIQSILALGQSSSRSSLVVDIHNPCEITNPQLDSKQLQRNTSPAGNELDFNASASGSGEALIISHDKTYAQSLERKASKRAYQKIYRKSPERRACQRAYQKIYRKSPERRAYQRAYEKIYRQTEKWKAYHRAYYRSEERKAYRKAYNQVLKDTGGDREQAKIAGKQASTFITESKKAKNNQLETNSISPPRPLFKLTDS